MLKKGTTSSNWVRGIADTLSAQGLDAAALFAQAGLRIENLDQVDFCWPSERISKLWTIAAERAGNPDIGLFDPDRPRPDNYGVVSYAMMSSPDLETSLARMIRYHRLVSDAATLSLEPGTGGKWARVEILGGEYPIPRQRYDYVMQTLLAFCRWMLGRPLRPLAATFTHQVPSSLVAYNEAFGAPLRFDAPFNGLLISNEDLASKLLTASPELAVLHDRMAGQALRALESAGVSYRARQAVARHLPNGAPMRATIAAELKMSDHTFQRRLTTEGTSFTKLIDETRRELVQHHLADTQLSSSEIAYLLGYADQSTFFRATLRWFGESPGEYRARVAAGP
ncbi:AraC family transcriptional regulator [Bradyrhizobium mercantei]|uniref:AraC family transcriptional regulator n=1 Tax=Bradyrhizobium mercantei TaxID=1904807 RepID=UPI001FD9AB48|nr:AraC family transcriptional regulator [Bradyrhizobium mercantei]